MPELVSEIKNRHMIPGVTATITSVDIKGPCQVFACLIHSLQDTLPLHPRSPRVHRGAVVHIGFQPFQVDRIGFPMR